MSGIFYRNKFKESRRQINFTSVSDSVMEGAVADWLVRCTPDRAVPVRVPAGALRCVLGQDT